MEKERMSLALQVPNDPLACLRWEHGRRFRALVPAGSGPRLFLHLSGRCLYRTEGQAQAAEAGEILFDSGVTGCERLADGAEPGAIAQINVPADLLPGPAMVQRVWQQRFGGIFPRGNAEEDVVLDWHRRQLLTPLPMTAVTTQVETEARIRQMALALLEPLQHRETAYLRSGSTQRLEHLESLARARASMAAHFAEECYRLPQAAEEAALSGAHFSQLFHRLTGLTAQEYLIRLRLEQARVLLLHSELNITDICYESGFRHPSHFAATFERAFGAVPSRWRQAQESGGSRRCFAVALSTLPGERTATVATARALPLYVRRGSALYLRHLALSHRGTVDKEALAALAPFLRRPARRNRAVRLIGAVCEGAGEAGVEAIRSLFTPVKEAQEMAPLALGEALRGQPFALTAAVLEPYLTDRNASPVARRHAACALGVALRDTADERALAWTPHLFRTGDGLLDNTSVISFGYLFRGSGNARMIALLSACLREGIARDVHDHTLSPACLCNSSEALALVCRGTKRAPEAAESIAPLLRSRDKNTVFDGVRALCRLFTGQAPEGLAEQIPYIRENRFPSLLALFDGAPAERALPALEALWSHPSLMLRRTLALALGLVCQGTGDARARALLEPCIRAGFPKLRGDALLALGLVEHTAGHEELFALAQNSVRTVQPYIARSALLAVGLGFQGTDDAQAITWATSFAANPNRYVAAAAIQALGLIGQGTRDSDLAAQIQALSRGDGRLANDADVALLMLDLEIGALDLLARWEGLFPHGQYASSFSLTRRCFARRPGGRWDVDEPFWGL
jgi:AraC-like DNA-binding protein